MKTTIIILTLTVIAACSRAQQGTEQICVNLAPSDKQRVSMAFGDILHLTNPGGQTRPATNEEMAEAIAVWMGTQTQDYERRQNMKNFVPPPFDPASGSGYMNGPHPSVTPVPGKAATKPTPKKK